MKTSGLDDNRVESMMRRMQRTPRYETRPGWMRKGDRALERATG